MEQICLAFPILSGKTQDAYAFMDELENKRKAEYAESEERIGITREVWFVATVPSGDQLIAYMETQDFGRALQLFSASQNDFDLWFKDRLANATGVDLNNPPPDLKLPELVSSYSVDEPVAHR